MVPPRAVTIGAALLCAIGCSKSVAQAPAGVDPAVCDAFYDALQKLVTCRSAPNGEQNDQPWPQAPVPDGDKAGFAAAYCGGLAKMPGAESLGDEMRACTTWMQSPGACQARWSQVPASCLLRGTLSPGAACIHDEQCQSGTCMQYGGADSCGTCNALASKGQSCGPTGAQGTTAVGVTCDVGSACAYTGQKCVPFQEQGAACSLYVGGDAPCDPPLDCEPSSYTCLPRTPLLGAGQTCSSSTPSTSCATGFYCPAVLEGTDSGAPNICTPWPVAAPGGSCALPAPPLPPLIPSCPEGYTCNGKVCVPFPKVGDRCGNPGCSNWLACVNGTCQTPDAVTCR